MFVIGNQRKFSENGRKRSNDIQTIYGKSSEVPELFGRLLPLLPAQTCQDILRVKMRTKSKLSACIICKTIKYGKYPGYCSVTQNTTEQDAAIRTTTTNVFKENI